MYKRQSVLYKGTAKKEISEQTAYTITYLGEESMPQQEEKLPLGFIIGGIGLALAAIGTGIYPVSYTHLLCHVIERLQEKVQGKVLIVLEDTEQIGKLQGINCIFCTVSREGEVRYYESSAVSTETESPA